MDAEGFEWILKHSELCSKRYQEAEQLLLELLPWHKRIFAHRKIVKFLKSRSEYNF